MEGKTDKSLFDGFIAKLATDGAKLATDCIVVESYEGRSNLNAYLSGLVRRTGFVNVESLGIIRDANSSADSAFQSVQGCLKNSDLPVPPSLADRCATGTNPRDARKPLTVSVFILPDNKSQGELETLLYRTLSRDIVKCIDDFVKCAKVATGVSPLKPDKARVAAYVAVQKKVPHSLAVSAHRGVWDFDHDELSSVGEFLQGL